MDNMTESPLVSPERQAERRIQLLRPRIVMEAHRNALETRTEVTVHFTLSLPDGVLKESSKNDVVSAFYLAMNDNMGMMGRQFAEKVALVFTGAADGRVDGTTV